MFSPGTKPLAVLWTSLIMAGLCAGVVPARSSLAQVSDDTLLLAETGVVRHVVAFPQRLQQFAHITTSFPAQGDQVALQLPTWVPGSYVQRPFDANLEILSVKSATGMTLDWSKPEKDTWLVDTGGAAFQVEYRVRADERGVSNSWVGADYVLLNGATLFLYTENTRDLPHLLSLSLIPGAGTPVSSLRSLRGTPHAWQADDYDELVDSPVLLSQAAPVGFEVDGYGYQLINVGDLRWWQEDQVVADLAAVVGAANGLWDEVPLERDFWFMNLINERGGGLEHDHSTVMQASRWQMSNRESAIEWLSLAAHEYLHVWNVRRLRPEALARYNYQREQYTDSLWLAEGLGSYYDDLILSRARVVTPTEYLHRLAGNVHRLELTPGRFRQSMAQASRDSWTRHYQPGSNALNQNVSYYVKGAVVGFVLDTRIRRSSKNRKSLDDVLQHFWASWKDQPYPEGSFLISVETVVGSEHSDWLRNMVSGTTDPDVDEALEWYGLRLNRRPSEPEGSPVRPGLGVNWIPDANTLEVGSVIADGAGARAGLLSGDELLAVNGVRMSRHNVDQRLAAMRVGDPVTLLVSRSDQILELRTQLNDARVTAFTATVDERFGDRHLRRLEKWLGQPLQP